MQFCISKTSLFSAWFPSWKLMIVFTEPLQSRGCPSGLSKTFAHGWVHPCLLECQSFCILSAAPSRIKDSLSLVLTGWLAGCLAACSLVCAPRMCTWFEKNMFDHFEKMLLPRHKQFCWPPHPHECYCPCLRMLLLICIWYLVVDMTAALTVPNRLG